MKYLPVELRKLVRMATTELGDCIHRELGPSALEKVENYRQQVRSTSAEPRAEKLKILLEQLREEARSDRLMLARAFTLYLEIVNCCETAYRTWRIQHSEASSDSPAEKLKISFVLTSHPTEARSPEMVQILDRLIEALIEVLDSRSFRGSSRVKDLLSQLWHCPIRRGAKPTVVDEADAIFSLLFRQGIFDLNVQPDSSFDLNFHTWVGGDKDGHPGVTAKVMVQCLEKSRNRILQLVQQRLRHVDRELAPLLIGSQRGDQKQDSEKLRRLVGHGRKLAALKKIKNRDGAAVSKWIAEFQNLVAKSSSLVRNHFAILELHRTFEIFPALVCPVEFREDADLIKLALKDPKAQIFKMLQTASQIAKGGKLQDYVRSLVVSHCEAAADILAAQKLVEATTSLSSIPVVPLFETHSALQGGALILRTWLESAQGKKYVLKNWQGQVQIMLGYSDSAKQMGVLPSRYLIWNQMTALDLLIQSFGLQANFFHGSGGSVDRGGGSLREQVAWWSESAQQRPKMTIQGEMIQRQLATPEILAAQCRQFTDQMASSKNKTEKTRSGKPSLALQSFVGKVEAHYVELVGSEVLGELLFASPYHYLDVLSIGSRPSKRPGGVVSVNSLRAIPWVLCWTQSRLLLPTWWGLGSAWKELNEKGKAELRLSFKNEAFFSSFMKAVGFTLRKVDLEIWQNYAESFGVRKSTIDRIRKEFAEALAFFREVTAEENLLFFRPWLDESIELRSPQIHILNFLQIMAMQSKDSEILREATAGIASGMMTTG